MKNILIIMLSLFSTVAFAEEDFSIKPTFHLGVGVEAETGFNASSYGVLEAKGFLINLGSEEIGLRLLGIGGSINGNGKAGLVLSPMSYYVLRVGIGPSFIIREGNTSFAATITYRF